MIKDKQVLERFENKENLSILVVDDNPMNLKMVASILKPLGYKLAMANSASRAIQFAKEKTPDLILLDVMMPEMDGFEACEILKADKSTSGIPIIFLTARSDTSDIVRGFQVGGVDYVTKPFKAEEILARIQNILINKISQDIISEKNKELEESQQSILKDAQKILALNSKLSDSEEHLKELNRTKDKFFSIISHDLKNQFSGVLGLSEVLTRFGSNVSDKDRENYLSLIFNGLTQMRSFLENLLEWARNQTGKIEFTPRAVALEPIVSHVILQYKNNAIQKDINLYSQIDDNLMIYADENMLMTILRNLISNALKFTNVGGNVFITAIESDNEVELYVKDDGLGMDFKTTEKLFKIEHNQSTPGTENEKGTGLGLILCKDFIEKHGGHIAVNSDINKGTTFTVTFPKK